MQQTVRWEVYYHPLWSEHSFWYPDEYGNGVVVHSFEGTVIRSYKNFWGRLFYLVKCSDGIIRTVAQNKIINDEEKSN
jgi:hypothetical protein